MVVSARKIAVLWIKIDVFFNDFFIDSVAEHSWLFYGFQNSSNSKTIGILTRKSSLCRKS